MSDDATPCAGRCTLFDSTDITDHLEAREFCAGCPMREGCNPKGLGLVGISGTLGGLLFINGKRRTLPICSVCGRVVPKFGRTVHAGYCASVVNAAKTSAKYVPKRKDGTRGPLAAEWKRPNIGCPKCGAKPGQPCRVPSGETHVGIHRDRRARKCIGCGCDLTGTDGRRVRCEACAKYEKTRRNSERRKERAA